MEAQFFVESHRRFQRDEWSFMANVSGESFVRLLGFGFADSFLHSKTGGLQLADSTTANHGIRIAHGDKNSANAGFNDGIGARASAASMRAPAPS